MKRCMLQNNIFHNMIIQLNLLTQFHFVLVLSYYIVFLVELMTRLACNKTHQSVGQFQVIIIFLMNTTIFTLATRVFFSSENYIDILIFSSLLVHSAQILLIKYFLNECNSFRQFVEKRLTVYSIHHRQKQLHFLMRQVLHQEY